MTDEQIIDGLEQLAAAVVITIQFNPALPDDDSCWIVKFNNRGDPIYGATLREALEHAIHAVF